jgi:hypothetical protein
MKLGGLAIVMDSLASSLQTMFNLMSETRPWKWRGNSKKPPKAETKCIYEMRLYDPLPIHD